MTSGAVTLRQIHGTREMLDVRCDRCGRAGRYRVATLVETYGLDNRHRAVAKNGLWPIYGLTSPSPTPANFGG